MSDMPDILARICEAKREEIERLKRRDRRGLADAASLQRPPRGFRDALRAGEGVSLIAEVKKASPSAGVIRCDFDPVAVARAYEEAGAACISVLTDREFFQGAPDFLSQIRQRVELPLLRKDFMLEELQLTESRALGADAFLLIVAALEPKKLGTLMAAGRKLDMDALVEVHNGQELEAALEAEADLIGINNRDLHTFEVSLETTERLAPSVPDGVCLVSESGIKDHDDVLRLADCGVDAVLVGETLMRADDMATAVRALMGTGPE